MSVIDENSRNVKDKIISTFYNKMYVRSVAMTLIYKYCAVLPVKITKFKS